MLGHPPSIARISTGLSTGGVFALLILVAGIGHVLTVRAQVASSTDFIIRDGAVGVFGSFVSSTDFQSISNGGALQTGPMSSQNFGTKDGPLDFDSFVPASQRWRWYSDVQDETPSVPLAAENTAPINIAFSSTLKLRLTIKETAGVGATDVKYRLQYSDTSDFSANVSDLTEAGNCTPTSTWCYFASSSGPDGSIVSSTVLSDSDSCSGGSGPGCGTHNLSGISTSSYVQASSTAAEFEFTIQHAGAIPNTTYFFRAYDALNDTPVLPNGTSTYPSLSTEGATLSFAIQGLPDSTSTGGIMTDVSSTATGVPFGGLVVNAQRSAAQRFVVSTDANQGYAIYTAQDQDLMDDLLEAIPPVVATNGGPASWNAACLSTSTGCYGYHTTASILAGGSTRFAANDTYARFETNLREVAYSAVPVLGDTTDIVYKVEVRGDQAVGSYQHNVNYIVVPVF